MHQELSTKKVAIVAGGENFFSQQFRARNLPFALIDEKGAAALDYLPDLFLIVNQGLAKAEAIKTKYPAATVIVCQGGAKHFSPLMTVIWGSGENNHDYHYFKGWDNFFEIISQPFTRQKKILQQVEGDTQRFIIDQRVLTDNWSVDDDSTVNNRWREFVTMNQAGGAYLEWHRLWLEEVAQREFFCSFDMKTDGVAGKKKVSVVSVPYKSYLYIYQGMDVFSLEDRVTFYDSDRRPYTASVIRINEDEITFRFERSLTRRRVVRLVKFCKEVNISAHDRYLKVVTELSDEDSVDMSSPRQVLAGLKRNLANGWLTTTVVLNPDERKILRDESQCLSLAAMLSNQPVTSQEGIGGSGKTFTQSVAAKNFCRQGKFVLLTSHSNQGLDVLLEAVAHSLGKSEEPHIFRLGNNRTVVTKPAKRFHRSERFKEAGEMTEETPEFDLLEFQAIKKILDSGSGVIVACTLNSLLFDQTFNRLLAAGILPQISFFDEATRGYSYEIAFLYQLTLEKVINTGDRHQLSNIPLAQEARACLSEQGFSKEEIDAFDAGLFKTFLEKGLLTSTFLRVCRRSLPNIIRVVNVFYDGQIIPGRFDEGREGEVIVYDFAQAQDSGDEKDGNSRKNRREANLLAKVFKRRFRKNTNSSIMGIITFYQAQIREIKKKLRQPLIFVLKIEQKIVDEEILLIVNTVDAFQGSERDEIFLSMVNSNLQGDIGFNEREERIVVSLTRARDVLIVFLNSATFFASDKASSKTKAAIREMILLAQENGTYTLVQ